MRYPKVTIIDYGLGNILSVQRGLEHCGAEVKITSSPKEILAAERVVLPGVGAFPSGMHALESLALVQVLQELAEQMTPLLGICLGMQLLFEESDEYEHTVGLGLIEGKVMSIPSRSLDGESLKIPHIGWSAIVPDNSGVGWQNTLLQDNRPGDAAYFVHSFMGVPGDPSNRIASVMYGGHDVSAVISKGSITGCQFHPEKSGSVGLKILRRFCYA